MSAGSKVPPQEEGEELSLQEIRARHRDNWVAVTVTKRDRSLQPKRGRVVAEDPDRYRLRDKLGKYKDVCILYAGDPLYPLIV